MIVNSDEMYDALGNVKLLLSAGGAPHVEFTFQSQWVKLSASDGHMYIETLVTATCHEGEDLRFGISPQSAKDMELKIAQVDDNFLDIQFDGPQVYIDKIKWDAFVTPVEWPNYRVMNDNMWESPAAHSFNFMQDRIRKLSLIKPRGKYPLSSKLVYHTGIKQDILLFKVGPRCQGALSLLDRDLLDSTLAAEGSVW